MSHNETSIKTDIIFKVLSALLLPLLAWLLSLTSDLSRYDEKIRSTEKEVNNLTRKVELAKEDLVQTNKTLAEITVTMQFIRKELEK
jgi:septal ring factor EnvC (AmiA/AmiB activator)